ncbi:hypothetical protein GCM10009677_23970 [Sphaerisporangium rubeum]
MTESNLEPSGPDVATPLRYEPNPKHKPVPSPGRHGSICPADANGPELLAQSTLDGRKRYATDGQRAFCAQQHAEGRWHGYPIGWEEVPAHVISAWVANEQVDRRTVRRARKRREQ